LLIALPEFGLRSADPFLQAVSGDSRADGEAGQQAFGVAGKALAHVPSLAITAGDLYLSAKCRISEAKTGGMTFSLPGKRRWR
jgi:hypothetical protein